MVKYRNIVRSESYIGSAGKSLDRVIETITNDVNNVVLVCDLNCHIINCCQLYNERENEV